MKSEAMRRKQEAADRGVGWWGSLAQFAHEREYSTCEKNVE